MQPDEPSPRWCLRLISELNAADERAISLAKTLTPQQLNWQPGPDEWSVGQCLEHLRLANEVYCRAIANSLPGHPLTVVQEIAPGWFGQWFIRNYIEPSAKPKRRHAPRKIKPGAKVEPSILDRFLNTNHEARELVRLAGNYDVNRIRFVNPFVSVIRFTVGTGLEIISKHERRHLLQAERIRDIQSFVGFSRC
jgi:hypothetical protein